MQYLGRKALPNLEDGKIEGTALLVITKVELNNTKDLLRVEAKASTLEKTNMEIKINIFKNSYTASIDDLMKICNVTSINDIVGKIIYAKLSINKKGYQEISQLYVSLTEEQLIYDPRNKKTSLSNIF